MLLNLRVNQAKITNLKSKARKNSIEGLEENGHN